MSVPLLIVLAVVSGLLIGSFLTVVVERVPEGGSVMAPPSRCGSCGLRLGPLDLVPVVSWIALRGKCRRCGASIGVDAIVMELATAGLFVLFAIEFQDDFSVVIAYWIFAATLVAQTAIDLKLHRLPREITFVGMALGGIALTVAAIVVDEPKRIWMAALGAVIAVSLIGAIYWGSKRYYGGEVAFGFGDVILSPLLGMYLGWLNPGIVAPGLFFGFVFGAVVGVGVMALSDAGRKTPLPFGPFMALGAIAAIFYGQHFVDLVLAR